MQIATQLLFALIPITTAQAPAGGTAQTSAVKHSYSTSNVLLELDGKAQQSLSRFGGSAMRLENPITSDGSSKRPGTGARPADVKIELPFIPNESVQAWITEALANGPVAHGIRILEGDSSSTAGLVHTLGSTTIRSLELAKLDSGSQELLTWGLSLGPAQVRWETGDGKLPASKLGAKLKGVSASSFRLTIDGVDASHVREIGPIRVEFGSTTSGLATSREPNTSRVAPIHLSFGGNDPSTWLAWFEEGRAKSKGARTMVLELLDASQKEVLARVTLGGAVLTSLSSPSFRGSAESAPSFEAEISCLSFAVLFQPKQ